MLVVMRCGSRVGEVMDFPPHEASAMLADGRAVAVPPDGGDAPGGPLVGVAADRMADAEMRDPVSRPPMGRRRRR